MPFFKPYSGTRPAAIARLETAVWVLLYGGLLSLVLGIFMSRQQAGSGMVLMVGGCIAALAGAVLVYVRSRMHEK